MAASTKAAAAAATARVKAQGLSPVLAAGPGTTRAMPIRSRRDSGPVKVRLSVRAEVRGNIPGPGAAGEPDRSWIMGCNASSDRLGERPSEKCLPRKYLPRKYRPNQNGAVASAVLVYTTRGSAHFDWRLAGATRSGTAGVGGLLAIQNNATLQIQGYFLICRNPVRKKKG
jgi:hypothetical protein